jgi:ABC-type uncharacterized transport system substrate-binding protein
MFPAMNHILGLIAAAAITFGLAGAASAHPHVWVTMKSTVVYAPDGTVIGVRHAWTFDDMFSTFATQGLESKKKGEFTREELQPLAKVNVESLKEYDFFTYGKANGKKVAFVEPTEYHLELNNSLLTLHFLLPFQTPAKLQTLDFEVFDPGYFVDFQLEEKDAVALSGAPAGCQFTVGKPQEMTREMAQRLSQIGPNEQIPENTFGAQFANKIAVKCP